MNRGDPTVRTACPRLTGFMPRSSNVEKGHRQNPVASQSGTDNYICAKVGGSANACTARIAVTPRSGRPEGPGGITARDLDEPDAIADA